jgi:hypothetical protein
MDIKRTFIAVLLSPFASLAMVAIMAIESLFSQDYRIFTVDGLIVMTIMSLGLVIISFAFVLLFGVPAHYLLSKLKVTHLVLYVIVGASIALIFEYSIQPESMPYHLKKSGYWFCGGTAIFVSAFFWYLAVKPHHQSSERRVRPTHPTLHSH